MEVKIEIPKYSKESGFKFVWEAGYTILTSINGNVITITANKAGLISIARHIIALTQDEIPSSYHFHLDEFNSLEAGSIELIIEKSNEI